MNNSNNNQKRTPPNGQFKGAPEGNSQNGKPQGGMGGGRGPGGGMGGGRGPGGGMGGFNPNDKVKDFKGTLLKLLGYLGKYKLALILVAVFAVCSSIFAIVGPKILGTATTELFDGLMRQIAGDANGIDFGAIGTIILTLAVIYLISASFSIIQGLIMTKITNNITYKLRSDIDNKIHALPFSYYDKTTNGEVLSRLTNDVDSINNGLNQSATQIITSITTLIGILIMMFSISWQLTIIALFTLPLSGLLVGMVVKKSQSKFVAQQKLLGNINSVVEETYSCHTIVSAFNAADRTKEAFNVGNNNLYSVAWKANFLSGIIFPVLTIVTNISYVLICVVGGNLAISGLLAIGSIQAFIQYTRSFNQPIMQLSQMSNVIQQTLAASERIFEFFAEKEESPDKENALNVNIGKDTKKPAVDIIGNVSFEGVNFGYIPDTTIINDFTTHVKSGQKIAIVGPTGAGKTTIVKLLMRFYDVNKGKILIDGHDIRDFKREELRKIFGMVLQETWLFNGSIEENIRYGKLDATKTDVENAAKTAQAHHFIKTLPNGYDLELNEEASNVSQGQKQLLTIARAILADPKILILDEATSSVDTRTEQQIQKAMDNLMKGRTSFIIAHRLSTIKNADLILVMKDGDIIEQGSHTELMEKGGFYSNLYNSQFEKVSA